MKSMDENNKSIIEVFTLAVIAGIGGGVNYVGQYLDKSSKLAPDQIGKVRLFQWNHFLGQCFVSSFCGGLVGYAFTKNFPDWSYVIAGFSGVFGLQLFYVFLLLGVRLFGKRTGIEVADIDITNKENGN